MRVVVALSGGKSSAYCAKWALDNYSKKDVVFYFNDTKWEHPDLYRFLSDLEKVFDKKIVYDSDGRSPEELFYDNRALANNRMPFCSKHLKAERLQKFYQDGDVLVFGIGKDEKHRADRILNVYISVAVKTSKYPELRFPLIEENISNEDVDTWLSSIGVEQPLLYRLGFTHNNCSGGCVRAGKKQWKLLYEQLPEVYAERERVEREVQEFFGFKHTFLRDESLAQLRERIEKKEIGDWLDGLDEYNGECIGICSTEA